MSVRVLVVALAVQLLLGGALVFAATRGFGGLGGGGAEAPAETQAGAEAAGGSAHPSVPRPTTERFDARRAHRLVARQVALGPRPAGSRASRRLASRLRAMLPEGRFEPVPGGLRNVAGRLPGSRPAVVIGAHYDTEATVPGHVGANDGAAGTAVVVELARSLARHRRSGGPELRFVLFDGEEEPKGSTDFYSDGMRGSRAYVRRHGQDVGRMILLDYVGNHGLRLPREGSSDAALWTELRQAARRVGVGAVFPARSGPSILDDHTPFLEAGIPAIDLIDWAYPHKDTRRDTLDKISVRSLDAVGEAVTELVRGF
jgi:glutaminyl-peptide cyclotransferase